MSERAKPLATAKLLAKIFDVYTFPREALVIFMDPNSPLDNPVFKSLYSESIDLKSAPSAI